MKWSGFVTLVAAGAIAFGSAAGGALPDPGSGSCGRLRGHTLVDRGQLKITVRVTTDRAGHPLRRFAGCVKPAGRVVQLGYSSQDGTSQLDPGSFSVSKTAGRFVLFRQFVNGGGGGGEQVDTRVVIDLKSGARRELWRLVLAEGDCVDEVNVAA